MKDPSNMGDDIWEGTIAWATSKMGWEGGGIRRAALRNAQPTATRGEQRSNIRGWDMSTEGGRGVRPPRDSASKPTLAAVGRPKRKGSSAVLVAPGLLALLHVWKVQQVR